METERERQRDREGPRARPQKHETDAVAARVRAPVRVHAPQTTMRVFFAQNAKCKRGARTACAAKYSAANQTCARKAMPCQKANHARSQMMMMRHT